MEKQAARVAAVGELNKGIVVPLVISMHGSFGGAWLTSGWQELLGVWVPLGSSGTAIAVVPSAGQEYVGLRDAVMVDDSTLFALFDTEVRVYHLETLAGDARLEWVR